MCWGRLLAIADEMAVGLTRTAFSPIVRDAHDYGCAVFDADGNMLAMASDATPGLSVSTMVSVVNMLEVYPPDALHPGDVLITNDPWLATGHLPDLTIVTPVFYRDRLVGFTAAVAHHMDIGGRKTTPASTEIFEEGLYLPVCKLYQEAEADETVLRVLERNVRVPEMVLGDVHAQVTANAVGAQRICELLLDYGWENLDRIGREVLAKADRAMRAAIAAIPDGSYRAEMTFDGFDRDLCVAVSVNVSSDALTVDYTGTSGQVDRGINCVLNYTESMTLMSLKMLFDPHTPINGGCMRPLKITAPPGTILSARYPAPVVGRSLTGHQIQPVLFQAMAAALPERVCAVSGGPIWSGRFYGHRTDGSSFLALSQLNGGMGARPGQDGISALSFPGNVATIPTEAFEVRVPLLVERKGLICDSGGTGQFRGGLGQEFRVRVLDGLDGDPTLAIRADRTRNPALGLLGGAPGRRGRVLRNGSESLHPKRPVAVRAGEVISWQLAGGGGYGDPRARARERVLADVQDGFISAEAAEREYGVVVRD